MSPRKDRIFAGLAVFCWLVTLLLILIPAGAEGSARCGRAFAEALAGDGECAARAARRVSTIVFWSVLTAPITLGYLVRRAVKAVQPAE